MAVRSGREVDCEISRKSELVLFSPERMPAAKWPKRPQQSPAAVAAAEVTTLSGGGEQRYPRSDSTRC